MAEDVQVINLMWMDSALVNGINKKEKVENAQRRKWTFHSDQGIFPQIEDELCAHVMDLRKSGCAVSTEILQMEASKIAQIFTISMTKFRAGYWWV
jgi:hypothetical protein